MLKDKILIFAYGRSGGSSLEEAIKIATCRNIEGEPFASEAIYKEIYRSKNTSKKIKEIIKRKLSGEMEGIKHNLANLMDYTNRVPHRRWGESEIEFHKPIIDFFGRVVLNGRKNLLKRMVSGIISLKTNIWNARGQSGRNRLKNEFDSFEVSVQKVHEDIQRLEGMWLDTKEYIEDENIPYYQVDYEDLFGSRDLGERIQKIRDIVSWLGFDFTEERLDEVKEVLDPNKKLNNEETYRSLIENVEELNEKLGPKYGYLF